MALLVTCLSLPALVSVEKTQCSAEAPGQPLHTGEGEKARGRSSVHLQEKRGFSWSSQGTWLTTLRWKKNVFYCFASNLAWSFKVSFTKSRTLHCAVLELPKLLMDSGGLDTARKDLPRQQKAENYFLGDGAHHQQHPHPAPRRFFSCCLLLKGSSAAILQRMGLRKCRTTAASHVDEQRIWNHVPMFSGEVLSSS